MNYYKPQHHNLDPYPNPKDKTPLFVNEPQLSDRTVLDYFAADDIGVPETEEDNVRIYVPIDLNAKAILRRLYAIIARYGEATEDNESNFWQEVDMLLSQVEIYDQIQSAREGTVGDERHSKKTVALMKEFVRMLEEIPDGCSEIFPFSLIDDLKEEYLDN
jgi:hypothetical protein